MKGSDGLFGGSGGASRHASSDKGAPSRGNGARQPPSDGAAEALWADLVVDEALEHKLIWTYIRKFKSVF